MPANPACCCASIAAWRIHKLVWHHQHHAMRMSVASSMASPGSVNYEQVPDMFRTLSLYAISSAFPCPSSPPCKLLECIHFTCKRQHTAWQGLCWCRQATLNVGFGRMLHVPKQLSQGQQASRSSSSNSSTPGPAAMLDFEQVALLPSNLPFALPSISFMFSMHWTCGHRSNLPNTGLTAKPCLPKHSCSAGRCCAHIWKVHILQMCMKQTTWRCLPVLQSPTPV